jgi:glycosyltransferase involved in cell wall biosynthesis
MMRRISTPSITTLHGRLDIQDLVPLYKEFVDIPVVSISNAQRDPLPWLNWQGTVYHGLPQNLYTYKEEPGKYFAFLGRICPEKRVDIAIEIAKRVGIELKIAAKVNNVDKEYFNATIKPFLHLPLVEYLGEIGEMEKNDFLGNAYAILFPIDWPEPFGLVIIEAMACGTPTIAYRRGSVPEIIEQGVTGFIVQDVDEAVRAAEKISMLSRKHCREVFEERFTATRMANDYLKIYQQLILYGFKSTKLHPLKAF